MGYAYEKQSNQAEIMLIEKFPFRKIECLLQYFNERGGQAYKLQYCIRTLSSF